MKRFALIILFSVVSVFLLLSSGGCSAREEPVEGVTTFRSQYKELSDEDARAMIKKYNFYDRRWNKFRSFPNKFELQEINKQKIVTDHATGLVWSQSGSGSHLTYQEVKQWLIDLNTRGYAGYKTWRLPTLEEAASLLESKREKNRYINPIFSGLQHSILSRDFYNPVRLWGVSFHFGRIFKVGVLEPIYVRPVAKMK